MSFPRYPSYKDSGVEWFDEIPQCWDTCHLKRLCLLITDGAHISPETEGGVYDFVSTKDLDGDSIIFDECLKTSPSSYEYMVRTGCKPARNDILFSKDGTIGQTVIVKEERDFAVASSLIIIRPDTSLLTASYLHYLCQSLVVIEQVDRLVKGAGLPRLSVQNLRKIVGVLPPIDDQRAIAIFLDRETAKIDSLMAEQRTLIDLLKEKRQAVISHAVTKGLNPDAPMKDSGVEWLGKVPEHWGVKRLRFLCEIQTGSKDTIDAVESGDFPFFVRSQTVERIDSFSFDCEAVLTAGDGVGVGKVFHYHKGPFDFHQRVYMFNNFKDISGKFFFCFLKENFFKVALEGGAKSTVDSLRRPLIQNFVITLPPSNEQALIVELVEEASTKLDALTAEANQAIALLQERRTALISAAVTGKIDVRGLAQ